MIVGGSFLEKLNFSEKLTFPEKFSFPLRIKCPRATLLVAFNEEMTPEQYLHS